MPLYSSLREQAYKGSEMTFEDHSTDAYGHKNSVELVNLYTANLKGLHLNIMSGKRF